jgi:hypothetical protein
MVASSKDSLGTISVTGTVVVVVVVILGSTNNSHQTLGSIQTGSKTQQQSGQYNFIRIQHGRITLVIQQSGDGQ